MKFYTKRHQFYCGIDLHAAETQNDRSTHRRDEPGGRCGCAFCRHPSPFREINLK